MDVEGVLLQDPGFDYLADELGTREACQAKLQSICADLQILNEKLVGTMIGKAEVKKEKTESPQPSDPDAAPAVEAAPKQEQEARSEAPGQVPQVPGRWAAL